MIRCTLDSPDLGQPFRYPEHDISMYRKNFRDTWSQKSPQNKAFWGLYELFWQRIFLQKLATFRFWSIKSPKDASEWFWSNWKIALCLKNVSDAYKAFQKCTENFFWAIFKKLFFSKIINPFLWSKKIAQIHVKRRIFEKKDIWKLLIKSFLCTSGILCRYLKRSSDTGLSSNYFRIILGHLWGILLSKNEKFPVFAKRYVAKIVCKVLKKPYFEDFFDFKCL